MHAVWSYRSFTLKTTLFTVTLYHTFCCQVVNRDLHSAAYTRRHGADTSGRNKTAAVVDRQQRSLWTPCRGKSSWDDFALRLHSLPAAFTWPQSGGFLRRHKATHHPSTAEVFSGVPGGGGLRYHLVPAVSNVPVSPHLLPGDYRSVVSAAPV